MKFSILALGLSGLVSAQGVTEILAPDSNSPAGCKDSYSGTFQISIGSLSKRDLEVSPNPFPSSPDTCH